MTEKNSIIVIGSGFAGSISALKLIEAGYQVTLLERGPWRDTKVVKGAQIKNRAPLPTGRKFYTHILRRLNRSGLPGGGCTVNKRGVYEVFSGSDIDVACSSQVGGNSHVYGALHMRPQDPNYWDGHNRKITSQYMETYYKTVLEEMESQPISALGQGLNLFADRFGDNSHFITGQRTMNIDMGIEYNPDNLDIETLSSIGLLGAADGIKKTADSLYLIPALEKGLVVKDMCEVQHISRLDDRGRSSYQVAYYDHYHKSKKEISGSRVIMAAGTMNSLKILLSSRDHASGLDKMPLLGQRFGGNGDYSAYWNHGADYTDLSKGPPTRGKIMLSDQKLWSSSRPWPWVIEGALPNSHDLPWLPFLKNKVRHGTLIAAMGQDEMNGRISLHKGAVKIDYNPATSPIYNDIRNAFDLIEELSGDKIFHFPKVSTVHPAGGACLGASSRDGVVGDDGQVFDHPGLYVVDGAALPAALGSPPSISIAAWAHNVCDKIIATGRQDA